MKLKRKLTDFRKLNGGHRPGSGAKKKSDKKRQIRFGIIGSRIDALGGDLAVTQRAKEYINMLPTTCDHYFASYIVDGNACYEPCEFCGEAKHAGL